MKRLLIILSIFIVLLVILITTKPSKERCKEEFKKTMITLSSTDFVIGEKDKTSTTEKLDKEMASIEYEVSENYAQKVWENDYVYKDYLIFCVIKFEGLNIHRKVGFGILNSTFEL